MYNKRKIKLHVQQNTKPIACAARHAPYAIKPKLEKELGRLEELGHLEKVEASEWAKPILPILKSNNEVRVCGDFKIPVNRRLVVSKRTFPRIDDIFRVLQKGKKSSQLDLPHAYMQIPVEEESRKFLTITTHMGLYRYTKMTEGISIAQGEFQQIMDNTRHSERNCLHGQYFRDGRDTRETR